MQCSPVAPPLCTWEVDQTLQKQATPIVVVFEVDLNLYLYLNLYTDNLHLPIFILCLDRRLTITIGIIARDNSYFGEIILIYQSIAS